MTTVVGRHGAPAKRSSHGAWTLVLRVLGVLAAGAAWVVLVRGAIDFGGDAKNGESVAWVFMAAAAVGATGCLLLVLVLVTRLLAMAGVGSGTGYQPKRARRG